MLDYYKGERDSIDFLTLTPVATTLISVCGSNELGCWGMMEITLRGQKIHNIVLCKRLHLLESAILVILTCEYDEVMSRQIRNRRRHWLLIMSIAIKISREPS